MNRPIRFFRLSNVFAIAALSAAVSPVIAGEGEKQRSLPGTAESAKLAERAGEIFGRLAELAHKQRVSTSATGGIEKPFELDNRDAIISFSVLPESKNLRSGGIDEVGRPMSISAMAPAHGALAEIVFPDSESLRDQSDRRNARERLSFAVLSGGVTISDLLAGDGENASKPDASQGPRASDSSGDSAKPVTYRGAEVEPASLPYFSDFESGERGTEWGNRSNITELEEYTSFTGPFRRASEVLHVRTDPGEFYVLQLDLYMIGIPENADPERSGEFNIEIDGAPMFEQNFGSLRLLSLAEGEEENADGNIIRQMQLTFSAASDVVEIVIKGDTGPGFGTGSWGFDNVLIDNAPESNLGSFASADFSSDSEIIGDSNARRGGLPGLQARAGDTHSYTPRRPRPFRDSQNLRDEQQGFLRQQRQDFIDMFPDPPEPDEDPDEEEPPVDETPDEEVPSPGPAALLMIGAGAAGLRRRR